MIKVLVFFFAMIMFSAGIIALFQMNTYNSNVLPDPLDQATGLYLNNCARCHGKSGQGFATNPALRDSKFTLEQIIQIIQNGSGKMPAFPELTEQEIRLLANYTINM